MATRHLEGRHGSESRPWGSVRDRTGLARAAGRFQSGQMGQTVNLVVSPSAVRIRLSPPRFSAAARHRPVAQAAPRSRGATNSRSPAVRARCGPRFDPVGGRSSMVEPQPSKLMAWVRFPSPAPAFLARPAHTEPPPAGPGGCCSSVVEHFLGKEEAMGSSPISSSNTSRSTQQPSREAPAGAPRTNQTNRAAAQSTTTETDG